MIEPSANEELFSLIIVSRFDIDDLTFVFYAI
jgi:hypothetical protein